MSDIGDMIERGSEGPEGVERASNESLRARVRDLEKQVAELQASARRFEYIRDHMVINKDCRNDGTWRWVSTVSPVGETFAAAIDRQIADWSGNDHQ
jgi:hypothetical protein